MTRHPLTGVRAIELSDDPGGEMLGHSLAEMGCEVVKGEPPAGAASRHIGPFVNGKRDENHSLNFWYYNSNKKSIVAELASGLTSIDQLLKDADILIASYQPAALAKLGVNYEALQKAYPKLIIVSLTPYGLT